MVCRKEYKELTLPKLGLGLMRLPTTSDGKIDYIEGAKMVELAFENGVNYFDTAWFYHNEESENFVGEVLSKYPRESYFLADKMPLWVAKDAKNMEEMFNKQLEKCKTSYFDFYLLHAMSAERMEVMENFGAYEFFQEKKRQGIIKNLGFSFHDRPEALQKLVDKYSWDFTQIQLNYLDWDIYKSKEQYEILTKAGIPVIVMEPVRGGSLATLNEEAVSALKEANPEASVASWALRFVGSLDNVKVILSGMSNVEQLKDNISTFTDFKKLSDEEYQTIEVAKKLFLKSGSVPCSNCKYCIGCPKKINIPLIFAMWNTKCLSKVDWMFIENYTGLNVENRADSCINCKKCVSVCPQKINIPKELANIAAEFKKMTEKEA